MQILRGALRYSINGNLVWGEKKGEEKIEERKEKKVKQVVE